MACSGRGQLRHRSLVKKTEAEWVDELFEAAETLRGGAEATRRRSKGSGVSTKSEHVPVAGQHRPAKRHTQHGSARAVPELVKIGDEMRRLDVDKDKGGGHGQAGATWAGLIARSINRPNRHNRWQDIDGTVPAGSRRIPRASARAGFRLAEPASGSRNSRVCGLISPRRPA